MRIRYARAEFLSQQENAAILRGIISSSGLPYLKAEKVNMNWPRIAFGPQLALGYASNCEYADLYFDKPLEEQEAFAALTKQTHKGFKLMGIKNIPYKFPSISALCTAVQYSVHGLAALNPPELNKFLSSKEIVISRTNDNGFVIETDIKPYVYEASFDNEVLNVTLRYINDVPLKVELFLAKWLGPGAGFDDGENKLSSIKIIKENLYYSNSLGELFVI
ncbi:radical SAM-linked protein [Elusimicrobium posterum]|uniref:DUF2344 domain-containing protein n=1 Tax=Elusimicrobium posterum TaxID=3116653 RepID=UPI003C74CA4D